MHNDSHDAPLAAQFREYLELSAGFRPDYIASLGNSAEGSKAITDIAPEAPELLKVIYGQVAGTSSEEEEPSLIEFIPGYRLIHIAEYAQEMQVLTSILEEKGHSAGGRVYPVLTNYGSDFICLWQREDGSEVICDLLNDFGDLVVMYNSPEKFLETLCEFYKQEAYFLDEEGFLDCDLIKEGEIGTELNPGAQYWSE
ncbi:hypothetical protein [Paenibacillus typhae]|uniref:SMI1-KNR4 cell-wall n=1 Tax=Paenibacillus typhae TaxID=1174501 RepID=A0A1G8XV87_9BACL|nr:hypothetical protein [Paenibacillus typhae]SDJ94407.1 hypothetical protein SAMN05216192_12759 [Paenibacillus typhae]